MSSLNAACPTRTEHTIDLLILLLANTIPSHTEVQVIYHQNQLFKPATHFSVRTHELYRAHQTQHTLGCQFGHVGETTSSGDMYCMPGVDVHRHEPILSLKRTASWVGFRGILCPPKWTKSNNRCNKFNKTMTK